MRTEGPLRPQSERAGGTRLEGPWWGDDNAAVANRPFPPEDRTEANHEPSRRRPTSHPRRGRKLAPRLPEDLLRRGAFGNGRSLDPGRTRLSRGSRKDDPPGRRRRGLWGRLLLARASQLCGDGGNRPAARPPGASGRSGSATGRRSTCPTAECTGRSRRKRGQVQFARTARRVLRTNWTCPLFLPPTGSRTCCPSRCATSRATAVRTC